MNGKKMIALAAAAVMVFAAAGSAMAATIEPNPGKIDINHVENRFITTNIEYKGNGMAELTLLENEQYDAEAVKAIQPGDVIHSAGGDITVQTAEWDGPDLRINAETEEEALLCDEGDGVFERVMEDDFVPQITIGKMECEILPYMVMLDWVDPVDGEMLEQVAVRDGEELVKLLESGEGPSFAVENVHILYDSNNKPMLIWRFYSPAQ